MVVNSQTKSNYGFTEKTPKSQDQQTQAAQEIAHAPPQKAHLAEITAGGRFQFASLRASLRALVATDPQVRAFYRTQRRQQLDLMAELRRHRGGARARVNDAVLLFTLERMCDALADGELRELGLSAREATALLYDLVEQHITATR